MKILVKSTHLISELWEFTCTEHLLSLKEQACVKHIGIYHHLYLYPDWSPSHQQLYEALVNCINSDILSTWLFSQGSLPASHSVSWHCWAVSDQLTWTPSRFAATDIWWGGPEVTCLRGSYQGKRVEWTSWWGKKLDLLNKPSQEALGRDCCLHWKKGCGVTWGPRAGSWWGPQSRSRSGHDSA